MSVWQYSLIAYLFVGLMIMLATTARREVFGALPKEDLSSQALWRTCVFYVVVFAIAFIFWPIFLPGWLRKKETVWDELQAQPELGSLKAVYDAMAEISADGCETDERPEAYGAFGHDVTNPIPTKTLLGSTSYLERLRAPDGSKVGYERVGSFSSPVSSHPVDGYEISHPDGTKLAVIYLAPYSRLTLEKAPEGLDLLNFT